MGSLDGFLLQQILSVLALADDDMVFDWKEYLRLAEYLRDNSKQGCFAQEAALRSSVSRAYYAAFCYARNYAREKDGYVSPFSKFENEHGALRKHFYDKGRGKIARHMDDLRKFRNNCDYDDEVENIDDVLRNSMGLAKEIIAKLT